MMRFYRKVTILLLCFLIFAASLVNCFASQVEFSLTDAEVKQNRLFEVTLNGADCKGVSAFVCELEYDEESLEYKSFFLNVQGADAEINSLEKGKIKAVFLCEESVSTEDKTPLVTFSFKALKPGEHKINLSVCDVINGEYEDLEAVCTSCVVNVAQIPSKEALTSTDVVSDTYKNSKEKENSALTSNPDGVKSENTKIKANDGKEYIIFVVLSVLSLLAMVGYTCYKLGAKKRKKVKDEK